MSEKKGFFKRLAQGLSKTRDNIASSFDSIFSGFSGIDEDFYEELEEILIMSDMGIDTTMNIIEDLKKKVKENWTKVQKNKIKDIKTIKVFLQPENSCAYYTINDEGNDSYKIEL